MSRVKEFLKPDRGKVLIFLLIPVTIVLGGFLVAGTLDIHCGNKLSCVIITGFTFLFCLIWGIIAQLPIFIFGYPVDVIGNFYDLGAIGKIRMLLAILLTIFWWYLLSCLIISLYHKLRPR